MKYERVDHNDITLLQLHGDLGKLEARDLKEMLEDLINEKRAKIVLDMEEIRYADSYAIMLLLRLNRECIAAGGEIKLLRPRAVVKRFMTIGQVLELFERYETKVEAINSFHKIPQKETSPVNVLNEAGNCQKIVIMRLVEILAEKSYFEIEEYNDEFNRSAQLVFEIFRKDLQE